MEPLYFFVAIMGCADGSADCREARQLPARYATAAACQASLPQRLAENADLSFPTIEGDCRVSAPRSARASGAPRPRG